MPSQLSSGIDAAYAERSDLVVVALTGRTGSGCSTAAKVLSSTAAHIPLGLDEMTGLEARKMRIVADYAKANWVPFEPITVSSVIWTFVLETEWKELESAIAQTRAKAPAASILKSLYEQCRSDQRFKTFVDCMRTPEKESYPTAWNYFKEVIEQAGISIKKQLGSSYAPLFQFFGDNLRLSGKSCASTIDPASLFTLIRRVKLLAKAKFYHGKREGERSMRVVIDAIRNPLELLYLRDQFATFYCAAITADDGDRTSRLLNSGIFNRIQVEAIDNKEYGSKSLKDYASFVSQNLQECIQKSDLFITNPGQVREFEHSLVLNRQIVTYVALMLRPGLVTPTRDERCMQLAFVAKLNSGCISRQVGAAVADQFYSVKSVGWNDVAAGQTPCLLRDVGDLLDNADGAAFSDYEKSERTLRAHLGKKFASRGMLKTGLGLGCPYCFKDAYNEARGKKENNQVHTRALHAEENAFLQIAKSGGPGVSGGVLYTTASPCELCSKKAYQLGIKEIVYVDPYPGISSSHVLGSGPEGIRPTLRLFSGAVGHAYHRLYDPSMPIKDEFAARLSEDPQPHLI